MRVLNNHLVSSDVTDLGLSLAVPVQKVPVVIASGTLSASFTTPGVSIEHLYGANVSVRTIGSMTGSIIIETANSVGNTRLPQQFASQVSGSSQTFLDQGIVDWNALPVTAAGATVTNVSNSNAAYTYTSFNLTQLFSKWIRVKYVHASGAGAMDVWVNGKGDSD